MNKRFFDLFFFLILFLLVSISIFFISNPEKISLSSGRVVSSENTLVEGLLSREYVDDPKEPHIFYSFITTEGVRYSLLPETYNRLLARADEYHFLTVNDRSLSNLLTGDIVSSNTLKILFPTKPSNFGLQNTIVILASNETQNLTLSSTYSSIVFSDVNNFVRENSYNQAWLSGNVSGWHRVNTTFNSSDPKFPISYLCEPSAPGSFDLAIAAADPFVDFRKYDTIIAVGPCKFVPSGSLGPTLVKTEDGVIYARTIELPLDFIFKFATTAIVAHELGHGFGLDHANAFQNCNPQFNVGGRRNCQYFNYGDPFDTMGGSFYSTNSSPHYSAEHKRQIGWIKNISLVNLNISFSLKPLEIFSINVLSNLSYPAEQRASYTLEYRIPFGFDANKDPLWPSVEQGIYLRFHYYPTQNFYDHIFVDAHPETATLSDGFLKKGENYTDYFNNLTFSVTNVSLTNATVIITSL